LVIWTSTNTIHFSTAGEAEESTATVLVAASISH
uniref:Uncharacterized protein n=1 Tax=Rodentolepis nana TaxID=102285 RepID=A0A0R3T935_RODNA